MTTKMDPVTRERIVKAYKNEVELQNRLLQAEQKLHTDEPQLEQAKAAVPGWRHFVPWSSPEEHKRDDFQAAVSSDESQVKSLGTQVQEARDALVNALLAAGGDTELAGLQKKLTELNGLSGSLGQLEASYSTYKEDVGGVEGSATGAAATTMWRDKGKNADNSVNNGVLAMQAVNALANGVGALQARSAVISGGVAFNKLAEGGNADLKIQDTSGVDAIGGALGTLRQSLNARIAETNNQLTQCAERLAASAAKE